MKHLLFLFLLPTVVYGQFIELHKIPSTRLDMAQAQGLTEKYDALHEVKAFEVSDFVTARHYKIYLEAIRYDSSEVFYQSQLPDLSFFGITPDDYFKAPEHLNKPVIGISWKQAVNFTRWLNTVSHFNRRSKHYYRLPNLGEWLAAKEHKKKKGIEINSYLSDWLINNKVESILWQKGRKNKYYDYTFYSEANDPPSMKRKLAVGGNFKFRHTEIATYLRQGFYEDSTYAHIGFRLVKVTDDEEDSNRSYFLNGTTDFGKARIEFTETSLFDFEMKDGMFHGPFVENRKEYEVSGFYRHNQRYGIWDVRDDDGQLILVRLYLDQLNYIPLYPVETDFPAASLNGLKSIDRITHSDGYYEYDFVNERDVYYSKRAWRSLSQKSNRTLFDKNGQCLIPFLQLALEGKVTAYAPDSDQFKEVLTVEEIIKGALHEKKIVGIAIKEDFFLDSDRVLGETRIIGMAPYALDKKSGEKEQLCWFYYPELRKHLAAIKVNAGTIRHMDDLFLMRYFNGKPYKTTNIQNAQNVGTENLDLKLIGLEHEFWVEFGR